ncbi:hypothetical protein BDF20DRAFT_254455 [Mycotypha africana]|uniref:uncharacterized protein n=1 Tax=Mycotypha africana TaxID=64632 RepID=UPI00230130EF|nr:uncharacterized protein BDF20DRAFT_254455 [Mycotypha africana]KAI8987271.1 hypothetical protein BDF20DRAFT_254455 [Mycotypha africana]
MAKKKTVNTKVEAANARKAAGKAEKENKKKAEIEALRRKQEAQKQLEEEEKALNKPKAPSKPNYTKKVVYTPNKPASAAKKSTETAPADKKETEEAASNKKKTNNVDKVLTENDIEKHPERRFKTALKDFEERELKNYRAEYPGLRLSQLKEIMYKDFQKSPENPFNQANVFSYNTSIEEVNRIIRGEPAPAKKKDGDEENANESDAEENDEKKEGAADKAAASL